jgi:hypothetical protein
MNRQAVVDAAVAELGADTHEKRIRYWESALGYEIHHFEEIAKLAWCGGFALYCLHTAGLALDVHWRIGAGFLLQKPHPLPRIAIPLPGDIGYLDKPFQHHFVVESVDGDTVHSVDGNQPDVRRKTRSLHAPTLTFFSIAPFLGVELPSPSDPPPKHWTTPAEVQHAVNNLIVRHPLDNPPGLLTVDGIIGPKSEAAIKWAQQELGIPVTGNPDAATCRALGLP